MSSPVRRSPAPAYRGEGPHALWHVSDEDGIRYFEPRASAARPEPLVWAIDTRHLPIYWFPRECPRGTFWADVSTADDDVDRFLHGRRELRVHVTEGSWLERVRAARIFAYRVPDATFEPHPTVGGYWTSASAVAPVECLVIEDPLERHAAAGIELRVVPEIWPVWDRVVVSTLEFSGIRLRNARERAP